VNICERNANLFIHESTVGEALGFCTGDVMGIAWIGDFKHECSNFVLKIRLLKEFIHRLFMLVFSCGSLLRKWHLFP
jgi:hypothetical protein